MTYCPSLYK